MTVIHVSGASLQPIARKVSDDNAPGPENLAWTSERWENSAEYQAGLAEQGRIRTHTIFRVDGRVVGVQSENGWTMTASGAPDVTEAKESADRLGLTGARLNDFVAEQMEQSFRARYGNLLVVDRASEGKFMTEAQLAAEYNNSANGWKHGTKSTHGGK